MNPLLIVPFLIRYIAGPLLALGNLAAACKDIAELECLDLNALWIHEFSDPYAEHSTVQTIVGDHAKPRELLDRGEKAFLEHVMKAFENIGKNSVYRNSVFSLDLSHEQIYKIVNELTRSSLGEWIRDHMSDKPPLFTGISVLWSGQVIAALVVSAISKELYPKVPVIWGGAHVTALSSQIANDNRYGIFVDGFVSGYAGGTFRDMCTGNPLKARGVFKAGSRNVPEAEEKIISPVFRNLELYGNPHLTLPVQTTRGCAHGRCAFCSYPAQEGKYRPQDLSLVSEVLKSAKEKDAHLSFKDAFLVHPRIDKISDIISNQVKWSVCTRLVPRIDRARLKKWVDCGLRTIEVGVESLDSAVLDLLGKKQKREDLEHLLEVAAGLEVHLVLNFIFGYPSQTREQVSNTLEYIDKYLPQRYKNTHFSTERNFLQVHKNAPLYKNPEKFGITITEEWPWSSTVGWNAPSWRNEMSKEVSGFHTEPGVKQ